MSFFSMPWTAYSLNNNNNMTMVALGSTNINNNNNNVLFYVLLAIVMFGSVFIGPLPGYIDSIVMNVVKTGPTESSYGAQRIFGSLGFSLASFVSGVCADHFEVVGMSR